jgi:hypothetical protein
MADRPPAAARETAMTALDTLLTIGTGPGNAAFANCEAEE